MPKISVVMPVHNTEEEYLRESVESILNQTYTDFEFIIIDDSSTDTSCNIIKEYNDSRINYQRVDSLSLPKALNYGLELAQGEYIARMDADDISLPTRFEKQVDFLDKNKEISVLGTWLENFPEKLVVKTPENPKIIDFAIGCYIGHPTVMFRKKDFDKYDLRYRDDYYCEDYDLWSRASRILNFHNLQEVLVMRRDYETNKSNQNLLKLYEDTEKIQTNILNSIVSNSLLKSLLKACIMPNNQKPLTFFEKIFSVKLNISYEKIHTVIRIFGLKFSVKGDF